MTNVAPRIVQNGAGLLGVLEHPAALQVGSEARIAVRLTDGTVVLVPVDLMVEQADGSFWLDLSTAEIARLETQEVAGRTTAAQRQQVVGSGPNADALVVPVVAESAEVIKHEVESGRVQIQKTVATTDQVVTDSLVHEDVEVERVPIHQIIAGPVGNRQDGDTLVVPVYKEVLVVEKRLMLVEEIRITRRRSEHPFTQTVPIRSESVVVTREDLTSNVKPVGVASQDQ